MHRSVKAAKALPGLAGMILAGLMLTSCSPEAVRESVPAPTTQATQKQISPALPAVPSLEGAQGIRSSAGIEQCSTSPGPLSASGQITNPGQQPADLLITMDWTTSAAAMSWPGATSSCNKSRPGRPGPGGSRPVLSIRIR